MAPKVKKTKAVPAAEPAPGLNWPKLQPLVPAADLTLETVTPNQIVTIANFWTSSLCKAYVTFLSTLPLVTTPGKPKKGDAVRVNDRFQIDDPSFAEKLWSQTSLKDILNSDSVAPTEDARRELWGGEVVRRQAPRVPHSLTISEGRPQFKYTRLQI